MFSTILGLEKIPWGVSFHYHNRQYRLLPGVPFFLLCFHFVQFKMRKHFHKIVSHPAFHFALLLLYLDHYQTTPWWYGAYEKVKSHVFKNIFGCGDTTINSLGGVVIGQDTAATAWWIFGRDYMTTATVAAVVKMSDFRIERGWIIITIHVSKRQVSHKHSGCHVFFSLHLFIKWIRPI